MIGLGVSLVVAPFAAFALIRAIRNQKRIERIENKGTKGIERWGINSLQKQASQNKTEDPMSRTHKTNITTSRPNPPVISRVKPSKQVTPTRPTQSRPVSAQPIYQTHHNDFDPLDVVLDAQDIMRNFASDNTSYSNPTPSYDPGPNSYDSGSSYDSFGGGGSDGGGASSDW